MSDFQQVIEFKGLDNVSSTLKNMMVKLGAFGTMASTIDAKLANVAIAGARLANQLKYIGLAAAGAGASIFWMSYKTSDAAESMLNLSQKTGVSVEGLQKLGYVADQAGIGADNLTMSFKFLNRSIATASETADSDAAKAFQGLGISIEDANGQLKSTEDVFYELSDAFSKGADGPKKVNAAMKLLGRTGEGLIPILNEGSDSIKKQGDKFAIYGNLMNKGALKAIATFNDEVDNSILVIKSLGSVLAQVLIPYMQPLVKHFADWVASNRELIKTNIQNFIEKLRTGFTALAPKLETAWGKIKEFWIAIGGLKGALIGLAGFLAVDLVSSFAALANSLVQLGNVLMATPLGRFIIVLGLIGEAIYLLNKEFPEFGKTVKNVAGFMEEKLQKVWAWIAKILEGLDEIDRRKADHTNEHQESAVNPKTGKMETHWVKNAIATSVNPLTNKATTTGLVAPTTTNAPGSFDNILKMLADITKQSKATDVNIKLDTENKVSYTDIDTPLNATVSVNSGPIVTY